MKEYPQEDCINCNKKSTSWCVCKQCRKNAKIVEKALKWIDIHNDNCPIGLCLILEGKK